MGPDAGRALRRQAGAGAYRCGARSRQGHPQSRPAASTVQIKAENDQLRQALQQATQIAREAQQDADEANDKLRDKTASEQTAQYNAETQRLKVTAPTKSSRYA